MQGWQLCVRAARCCGHSFFCSRAPFCCPHTFAYDPSGYCACRQRIRHTLPLLLLLLPPLLIPLPLLLAVSLLTPLRILTLLNLGWAPALVNL